MRSIFGFKLSQLSINAKLYSVILIELILSTVVLGTFAVHTIQQMSNENIARYEEQVMADKKEALKNYVDLAMAVLQIYRNRVTADTSPAQREQIQAEAVQALDSMVYGNNDGYIFIWTYDGVPLAFKPRPDLLGKPLLDLQGGDGQYVIRDLIAKAQKGGGHYYQYKWKTTKDSPYQTKLSYSVGVDEWRWFVGTGEYMAKEEREIAYKKAQLKRNTDELISSIVRNAIIMVLITSTILFLIIRKIIFRPLKALADGLGDFFLFLQNKKTAIQPIPIKSNDELGKMSAEINQSIKISAEAFKRLNDINKQLNAEKRRADAANRTKSDFLANMSHEIRTPMNAIIGMTRLALNSDLNERDRDHIQKAYDSAHNLLGLINDILDVSKIESGKLSIETVDFPVDDVRQKIKSIMAVKSAEAGIEFECYPDPEAPKVLRGDPLRLQQILLNLCNNAIKFTPSGGRVEARCHLESKTDDTAILRFSVEDTGIGMSAEQQQRIFQPFTQADSSTTRRYGGTGLGLTISKKLVELMGGEIWVESEENVGSTFHFRVKLDIAQEQGEARGEAQDPAAINEQLAADAIQQIKGKRVLVVEDNEINLELAVDLLESEGIHVDTAINGQQALDKLAAQPFDAVLMDCQMPVMDGFEATRQIRQQDKFKNLPIIALTANAMKGDREAVLDAGMNDHIAKPFDPDAIFITLAKWIKQLS